MFSYSNEIFTFCELGENEIIGCFPMLRKNRRMGIPFPFLDSEYLLGVFHPLKA
jgi:hypothetical protein